VQGRTLKSCKDEYEDIRWAFNQGCPIQPLPPYSAPSKQNFLASSHAVHASKRARDSDDADDQYRKRRRQNAKPAPDAADPLVRLLACPYQKHDPRRYSEANLAEKEYRVCASC
jgi:hypothetical protein